MIQLLELVWWTYSYVEGGVMFAQLRTTKFKEAKLFKGPMKLDYFSVQLPQLPAIIQKCPKKLKLFNLSWFNTLFALCRQGSSSVLFSTIIWGRLGRSV